MRLSRRGGLNNETIFDKHGQMTLAVPCLSCYPYGFSWWQAGLNGTSDCFVVTLSPKTTECHRIISTGL